MAEAAVTGPPYEEDFLAWSEHQAAILRRLASSGVPLADGLDIVHVAEEMETLGKEQLHGVRSAPMRIMQHLLKLEHSPAPLPRRHWAVEVDNFRADLADRLGNSPSLRPRVGALMAHAYPEARRLAARDLQRDKMDAKLLPEECPYGIDKVMDDVWLPANRHGLEHASLSV